MPELKTSRQKTSRHMTLIVPAVAVSCVAVVALSTNFGRAEPAPATNETAPASKPGCLSAPGAAGPEGSHWYYRIDRANNNRRCWYLGERSKLVRQAVSAAPQPVPQPAPQMTLQSASSISAQPAPRAAASSREIARPEERSVGTRVDTQIERRSAPPAVSRQEEPSVRSDGIVMSFSTVWPSLPQAPNSQAPNSQAPNSQARRATGSRVSTITMGYADEPSSADQGSADQESSEADNMPLIWPVLAEADTVSAPLAPGGFIQRMLPWGSAALVLAGILVGLICRFTTPRQRSRADRRAAETDVVRVKKQPSGGTGSRLGQNDLAWTVRERPDAALPPPASGAAMAGARISLERDRPRREYQESLHDIFDRLKRSAA